MLHTAEKFWAALSQSLVDLFGNEMMDLRIECKRTIICKAFLSFTIGVVEIEKSFAKGYRQKNDNISEGRF